jgi:hypothetical protein
MAKRPKKPRPTQATTRRSIEAEFESTTAQAPFHFDRAATEDLALALRSLDSGARVRVIALLEALVHQVRSWPQMPSRDALKRDLGDVEKAADNLNRALNRASYLLSPRLVRALQIGIENLNVEVEVLQPGGSGAPKKEDVRDLAFSVCELLAAHGVVSSHAEDSAAVQCVKIALTAFGNSIEDAGAAEWVKDYRKRRDKMREILTLNATVQAAANKIEPGEVADSIVDPT